MEILSKLPPCGFYISMIFLFVEVADSFGFVNLCFWISICRPILVLTLLRNSWLALSRSIFLHRSPFFALNPTRHTFWKRSLIHECLLVQKVDEVEVIVEFIRAAKRLQSVGKDWEAGAGLRRCVWCNIYVFSRYTWTTLTYSSPLIIHCWCRD